MQVVGQQVPTQVGMLATGKRVRNTYATFLQAGNSPGKPGLIPHKILEWHHSIIKASAPDDGRAAD